MASNNTYKVGDFVYIEHQPNSPYLIRRVDELTKTPNGNVDAKVACYYRKRDINSSLLTLSEKHSRDLEEEMNVTISDRERHLLNHKELFLSRQIDTLPASNIRGKCNVILLNETEDLKSYITKPDCFYYTLVYDPLQKTLVADRGEIRVGNKHQAEISEKVKKNTVEEEYKGQVYETLTWKPNQMKDELIESTILVAKSIGTYARAMDNPGSSLQPSLLINAAYASRDTTTIKTLDLIHQNKYDFQKTMQKIASPNNGPLLVRDELEFWTPHEANLFEEAIEKLGKSFSEIQQDFLPWKTIASLVEYYYMYKTSDRYIDVRRAKAVESESRLKQIYIPPIKNNANQIKPMNGEVGVKSCEGCHCTTSYQWYSWGPQQAGCRLCSSCWSYWKKYAGLKSPQSASNRRDLTNHKINGMDKMDIKYNSASNSPICEFEGMLDEGFASSGGPTASRVSQKTKQAFFLNATKLTRIARRLCGDILKPRRHSRKPFVAIQVTAIKAECQVRLNNGCSPKFTKRLWPKINSLLGKVFGEAVDISQTRLSKPSLSDSTKTNHNRMMAKSLKRPLLLNGTGTAGT